MFLQTISSHRQSYLCTIYCSHHQLEIWIQVCTFELPAEIKRGDTNKHKKKYYNSTHLHTWTRWAALSSGRISWDRSWTCGYGTQDGRTADGWFDNPRRCGGLLSCLQRGNSDGQKQKTKWHELGHFLLLS